MEVKSSKGLGKHLSKNSIEMSSKALMSYLFYLFSFSSSSHFLSYLFKMANPIPFLSSLLVRHVDLGMAMGSTRPIPTFKKYSY